MGLKREHPPAQARLHAGDPPAIWQGQTNRRKHRVSIVWMCGMACAYCVWFE